ncbi:MAG: ribosome biogenesis GTPase YlqF [Bacilli bacterium]|nr:ribosome biogenesis GTPase YlqF [Bacilli bacterium]
MNDKNTINWYPGHMEKAKRLMIQEYKNIDIVYELVDARIPKSSKISNIYDIIGNKPKILIMTKKDLAEPLMLEKWIKYYENLGTKVIAVNLNDENDIKKIITLTNDAMTSMQEKREEKGLMQKEIRALVVGIPNVGKSTLINKMVGKKVALVGNRPGLTTGLKWLKTKHNIVLLDTPGILWPKLDNTEIALNLASFFSIKTEVLDVNEVAVHIINKLNHYYPDKLEERYGIKPANELDYEAIYDTLGRNMGAVKHNEVDYERVSLRIINDIKDEYIKGIVFDHEV